MKKVLLIIILAIGTYSSGQNQIDVFQSYYRISPNNSSNFNQKINYVQFGGELKVPVVLKNSDALIFGYEYNYHSFQNRNSDAIPLSDIVHENKLIAGIKHNWNEKWNTIAFYVPKFNGDFKPASMEGFQHGGLVLNSYSKTENLDLKFGAYVNSEEFGTMIVPLLGWNWKINDSWRFKGMIPVSLEVIHSREKSNFGLLFIGKNASFYKQNEMGVPTYVDMADNNAWLYSEFKFAKNWLIHFRAGHSVLRKFRYFTDGDTMPLKIGPVNIGDDRVKQDTWFDNGFSFETRLIFRLPTD
ncbi:MAG: DUF6268 family outer membrane beta-barrel protein [Crocinitomicaceae bacterium]|nr:DUF6268 family outer membrane beta-barrel protein [Crocinitomicaceae bacterium]